MVGRKRVKVNVEFLIDVECSMYRYLYIFGIFIYVELVCYIICFFVIFCILYNLDFFVVIFFWIFYFLLVGVKREKKIMVYW